VCLRGYELPFQFLHQGFEGGVLLILGQAILAIAITTTTAVFVFVFVFINPLLHRVFITITVAVET
jgi:hypothetical protein